MRILFLEPAGKISGGGVALLRLVRALDRRRFRPVIVLGSPGPLAARLRRVPGVRVLVWPFPEGLATVDRFHVVSGGARSLASGWRFSLKLRRLARRLGIAIVHANGLKMDLLSIPMISRRRALVWHIRDLISTDYMAASSARIVRFLAWLVPDLVICNSETTRHTLLAQRSAVVVGSGVEEETVPHRVHAVADGLPSDEEPGPRSFRREDQVRIVLVGRIAAWKGQHLFVEAARLVGSRCGGVEFLVAGAATTAADAEYERRLVAESAAQGGAVRFLGQVEDIPELLGSCDILVHCSMIPEPFGQVVLEGMAAGLAVVAADRGGPTEILRPGHDGLLFELGSAASLAAQIERLVRNRDLREALGGAAVESVRERFGIERTAARISALYDRLAQSRHLPVAPAGPRTRAEGRDASLGNG